MDNQDIAVHLENVTYCHMGKDAPTLQNINLDIKRGTINIIVGPSGSGKTTLCDIIAGAIPHLYGGEMTGKVIVNGHDSDAGNVNDIARQAGKVFQDPEVMFSKMEVEDELAFGPENTGFDLPEIQAAVEETLEYVDLIPLRHNLVWELSGGQIQRLGLGCILAMKTPIIIMDEPTANLDPLATRNVHSLIRRLKDGGITVILVTKEMDEFLAQADAVFVLHDTRLILSGTPQDVIDQHGEFLAHELGVWLPEVCELGLGMRQKGLLPNKNIPLTVDETLAAIEAAHVTFSTPERPNEATLFQVPSLSDLAQAEVLVSARNLAYHYPSGCNALRGVSFEIRRGDLLAIVGRNGAGKSTLSKLLVGLLKPQPGALTLFGHDANEWQVSDLAEKIALVFQNPEHQFLTDTVFDEIAYSYLTAGVTDPVELKTSVDKILDMLDLADVAKDHPFALSAGKKRRLGVAAMLPSSPEILVVDEPTYGQDKAMTTSLMELILKLRQSGITVVMITHSMRLVEEYVNHAIVMNNGEITFDGSTPDLFCQTDVLSEASLAVTTLQSLVSTLCAQGHVMPDGIRSVKDFVAALSTTTPTERQNTNG